MNIYYGVRQGISLKNLNFLKQQLFKFLVIILYYFQWGYVKGKLELGLFIFCRFEELKVVILNINDNML